MKYYRSNTRNDKKMKNLSLNSNTASVRPPRYRTDIIINHTNKNHDYNQQYNEYNG